MSGAPAPAGELPSEGMELTHLLVVSDVVRARAFHERTPGPTLYWQRGGTTRHSAAAGLSSSPPTECEWEVRRFFRDPDGHLMEISEARSR